MDVAPVGEGQAREPASSVRGGVSEREAALAELASGARGHAGRARAASTERGYAEDWTRFRLWCLDLNLDALPADPLTVALYLTHLAPAWRPATNDDPPGAVVAGEVLERRGLAPGSIARALASISVHHRAAGHPSPARDPRVLDVLSGIRRHPGVTPPRRRAAARRHPLAVVLGSLRPEGQLADARDAALLLIGWKAALRTDDLARLQLVDLHASEQGLSVFIARSKTDQTGHGTTLGIAAPGQPVPNGAPEEAALLDAGAAWVRWRDLLGSHGVVDGPAWRGIDRYGRRPRARGLHRNALAEIIKRRAAAAGLDDAHLWAGHSLRRGFATEAIAAGVPERDVQHHGRWRSRASMDPYIDAARTFDPTNPTHWLT